MPIVGSVLGALKRKKVRLQLSISMLFMILILPVLALIMFYSYRENSRNLISLANVQIERARDDSIAVATNLLEPVSGTLRMIAEIAASNPAYFRTEQSRDLLYQALISADQIDAIYTSFEDGYHRVVTRMDANRRRSDRRIPSSVNWHSSYIDAFSGAPVRQRHRTFFEAWPTPILQYDDATDVDIRNLQHYQAAKRTRTFAIADPLVNPDTRSPVISVGYPIIVDNKVIGVACANITFDILARHLATQKTSSNSTAFIIDHFGKIIAHPDPAAGIRSVEGKLVLATVSDLADQATAMAGQARIATGADRVTFTVPATGVDYIAVFSRFPPSFPKPWEVAIVVPLDDFVGGLKQTNRNLVLLIIASIVVEVLLIIIAARRIAKPIELVSQEMHELQSLQFSRGHPPRSMIGEIFQLQQAVNLMSNSLRSFSAFVPVGIVRELVNSGRPLTLSGESRFLTIFFSDLEDFSTVSEHLSPEELMRQVSSYFEVVVGALTQESATIDKFIGDSVMAFWGAPTEVPDQVYRACVGTLRAAHRVGRLNDEWARFGRPQMRMRIGLHCADVVVGNVGSSERLSYTVMGDGVNVASRLEGVNKIFHTTICISDSVYNAVADRIIARPIQFVSVKGRQSRVMVYELIGIRDTDDPELSADDAATRLCTMTTCAMTALTAGHLIEARVKYEKLLAEYPSDPVAGFMVDHLMDAVIGQTHSIDQQQESFM
jgi:class 3 adenylate cyclase